MRIRSAALSLSLLLGLMSVSAVAAKTLAQQVQQAYQDCPALRANFVQKTHVALLDKEVEEQGTLLIAKPGRFVIHYLGRKERKYISDGKTLWIGRPHEPVEVIQDLDQVVSREALSFLGGLGEMTQEFTVQEDQPASRLTLIPKSKRSPFKKIELVIDPKTDLASEILLASKSGNASHYWVRELKREERVADHEFRP